MAERRPLTARDVKGNVEGYSEMSDEAFARRFYSDRAELTALGVPLTSQRDEFTGEELYSLRSEHYFLDQLDLDEDELAALQTALYTLEGKFAYAEPLRLALQNLALGRPGFQHAPTATAERVRVSAPDYSPELAARLSKLESAISKQRTIQFRYWSPARERETERRLNPYALRLDEGVWYVVGHDLDRDATRTFRVARIRSDIRFATRRERDFRQPPEFDVDAHRVARPWQIGEQTGLARIEVHGDTAWWVHRTLADAGTVVDGVFETPYSVLGPLASWILRQNGRAVPLEPKELRDEVAEALRLLRERHGGAAPGHARERRADRRVIPERQPAGPVAPERFGVLQALLAHLLAACGDERGTVLDADELAERFSIPREELQETLSLLNLVNFGGGCYTVYAEVDEETGRVRVDKELYGDVFRKAPKLTPLEARAIRLAIEYVGPTIAADAHTPLARVRHKLEETFGQFELAPPASERSGDDEEALVRTLSEGAEKRRLVELEYLKEGEEEPSTRLVEPYTIERELPFWRVHTWDRTVDGPRTYRLDRMRSATLTSERFESREGFDPNYLAEPATAVLWHSPTIARWKLERGARPLTDKAALSDVTFKTEEWLLSEVLADRGETVVLDPAAMRRAVAARARALQTELGLGPRRRKTAAKA
jgi:proteasome accessory factor C